jgi:hypothetical protein
MPDSSIDVEYVRRGIAQREHELRDRYFMYCKGINENGKEMSNNSAAVMRSNTKRDMSIIVLLDELLGYIEQDFVLSDEAAKGYMTLCEPYERHRNYRG